MAIEIKNYDGTTLTIVQDGTADNNSSSIPFVGKGYKGWGTPLQQNLLWIMQNFAGENEPTDPTIGQLWYDTLNNVLKTYTTAGWTTSQGVVMQATAPTSGNNVGSMWFDTVNMQLYTWTGTKWTLIGPLASSANTDPSDPPVPTTSAIESIRIMDNTGVYHNVWRLVVGGTVLAIFSRDASFVPQSSLLLLNGFPRVYPGITFYNTLNGIDVGVFGDDVSFKSTQTNLPSQNNAYNLGSAALKFLDIFASNGKLGNVILGASGTVISESSDGTVKMTNAAGTAFGLLQLGGTTNSFPAIKRAAAAIHFRRADDSEFADITANIVTATTVDTVSLVTDTLVLSSTGTGSRIVQAADGIIRLTNNAGTAFTRLQLGGTTASFPAIKRNGAAINFRLADDSADANISAGGVFVSGAITSSGLGGIGYATGAGDNLTQVTSLINPVTSTGSTTGQITLFSGARADQTNVTFSFINPSIAATDHVVVSQIGGTMCAYIIGTQPAAGSVDITLRNISGAPITESVIIKYSIIKSVNA